MFLAVLFYVILWSVLLAAFAACSNSHPGCFRSLPRGWDLAHSAGRRNSGGLQALGFISFGLVGWWHRQLSRGFSGSGWALLDTIQIVGMGMMLIAALTRHHVMGVLIASQVIGGVVAIIAKATSPNAVHPTATFPDFIAGSYPGLSSEYFWLCLVFQLIIPFGFFKFFRKEQVTKP